MKSGTAQKLVLNMISTAVMIKLGRVKGNKMIDMQLSNEKLVDRGIRMVMNATGTDHTTAEKLLNEHGSVRKAVDAFNQI
jgi:N-acetylmuramic acid 6-phosphate etherase